MIAQQNTTFTLRQGEEYIQLIQLLKAVGCVETGAEAQESVTRGLVKRNGQTELRKRAKLVPGDIIEFKHYIITIA